MRPLRILFAGGSGPILAPPVIRRPGLFRNTMTRVVRGSAGSGSGSGTRFSLFFEPTGLLRRLDRARAAAGTLLAIASSPDESSSSNYNKRRRILSYRRGTLPRGGAGVTLLRRRDGTGVFGVPKSSWPAAGVFRVPFLRCEACIGIKKLAERGFAVFLGLPFRFSAILGSLNRK